MFKDEQPKHQVGKEAHDKGIQGVCTLDVQCNYSSRAVNGGKQASNGCDGHWPFAQINQSVNEEGHL